ncbi:MAG: alpha/beta fold hydrolase [Ornithinimicrobium sp.]|uniref:alpha/beta fold hydrolase n=1 Tax=Ornithinimicrobium sp. TaxID=1977084 RepID=UPI003D9BD97A
MSAAIHTPAGQVRYAVSGPSSSGRPDLVLIHGWCCESSSMITLKEAFGAEHRIIEIDLRGHGDSSRIEDDGSMGVGGGRAADLDEPVPRALREVRIEDYADDVWQICRTAGLRSPVLIGHSMGALVVLATLAARAAGPQGPVAGVLLDPAPVVSAKGKEFWAQAAPQVAADRSGRWRTEFAESLFLPTDRASVHAIVETMARFRPAVAAGAARAMAAFDGEAALRALDHPLLVLHAATAERQIAAVARAAGLALTTGQTVGAGHFHHLEVPEQVMPMIRRWLEVTELPPR